MSAVVPNQIFGLGLTKCDKMFCLFRLISTGWSLKLPEHKRPQYLVVAKATGKVPLPLLNIAHQQSCLFEEKNLSIKNLSIPPSCTLLVMWPPRTACDWWVVSHVCSIKRQNSLRSNSAGLSTPQSETVFSAGPGERPVSGGFSPGADSRPWAP